MASWPRARPSCSSRKAFKAPKDRSRCPTARWPSRKAQANRITRIAPDNSTSSYLENSGGANGLAFNAAGELIAVVTAKPGIAVLAPAGKERVLVDQFEGTPLNRPNDLVVDKRGGVYFTDPGARPEAGKPAPQDRGLLLAGEGRAEAAGDRHPRGRMAFSSARMRRRCTSPTPSAITSWPMTSRKMARSGKRRNFAKLDGVTQTETGITSGADGLAVDAKGRLYVASAAGVQVFDSKGAALGTIPLPKAPQNLAFAGEGKKTLYVVGRGAAYRIAVLTPGFAGRVK